MNEKAEEIFRLSAKLGEQAQSLRPENRSEFNQALRSIQNTAWALYWAATPPPVAPGGSGPTSSSTNMTCPLCSGSITVTLS